MLLQWLFEHKKRKHISFSSQVFKNEQQLYLNIKAVNPCCHCHKVGRVCLLLINAYSCKIKSKKTDISLFSEFLTMYTGDKCTENSQWLFCCKCRVLLSKHGLLKAE